MKLALVKISKDTNEPLNLLCLAAYVQKECEVKIFDMAYDKKEDIIDYSPNILGFSAMTSEYDDAVKLCKEICQSMDETPLTIIGGVHITFVPDDMDECFDFKITGEGEKQLLTIIKCYKENRMHEYLIDEEPLDNIDDIPNTPRELLNDNYFRERPIYNLGKFGKWQSIITSRGCPYHCKFCVSTNFFKKVRLHSAEWVVREIKNLYELGITHIEIWDDLFCIDVNRIKKIIELLRQEELLGKITYSANMRANLATDELFSLYKELGVKITGFGFESGSNKILQYLKGNEVSVEKNFRAIELGNKYKMRMMVSFMIGVPGETKEDMLLTLAAMKKCIKLGVKRMCFFTLTPLPGSYFWNSFKEKKNLKELSFFNKTPLLIDSTSMDDYKKIRRKMDTAFFFINHLCLFEYFRGNPFKTISLFIKKYMEE